MKVESDFNSCFKIYPLIKKTLADFLSADIFPFATPNDISPDISGYELSCPLIAKTGADESKVSALVSNALITRPPLIFGAELIKNAAVENGHILFALTTEAYSKICKHIILNAPNPPFPALNEPHAYTLARMIMFSGKQGEGIPDNVYVKKALWLAFGLSEFTNNKSKLNARLNLTCSALEQMTCCVAPKERAALLNSLGDACKCASRLLHFADNSLRRFT